jgi:hypothetical protein
LQGLKDYYAERISAERIRALLRSAIREQATCIRRNARQSAAAFISDFDDRAAKAISPLKSDLNNNETEARQAIGLAYEQAMAAYVPRRYAGRVTLLWPEELPLEPAGDATCGWRKAAAKVDTQIVPGGHLTCITKFVEQLAGYLKLSLARARHDC